jgi:isocitrate lyase
VRALHRLADDPELLVGRERDIDDLDATFCTGERTEEGFFRLSAGIEAAVARGLAYAPYSDLLWFETSTPDLAEAEIFAAAINEQFPGIWLAYNCSPSFNWRRHLSDAKIRSFQRDLARLGYRFQFVTLAGFHSLNASMFDLARGYRDEGMSAYVRLQEHEFALEETGYSATRHQREAGAGYFDQVLETITGGAASTLALRGSTEEEQFGLDPVGADAAGLPG